MSLWRVTVETIYPDGSKARTIAIVLAQTEIGAKRAATKKVHSSFEDHATAAVAIDPYKTGVLLLVRQEHVRFIREEVTSGQ